MKRREKYHLEHCELSVYTVIENFKRELAETNSVMTPIYLPPLAWNCHTHCFNPENYPFKATRAYTPEPARVDALIKNSFTDQLMLVQATIEDGYRGLIGNLNEFHDSDPSKRAFGTIFWDPEAVQELQGLTAADFDTLHDAGKVCSYSWFIRGLGWRSGLGQEAAPGRCQTLSCSPTRLEHLGSASTFDMVIIGSYLATRTTL